MTAKRAWLILAALVAAPVVGWILGGALVLLGLNVALKRFEQAELDDDTDEADTPIINWMSTPVDTTAVDFDPQKLWRDQVADYREYREDGYL